MLLRLNGREVDTGTKSRLSDIIEGEPYAPGTLVAVTRSTSSMKKETSEFEIVTPRGSFIVRLNGSEFAKAWRDLLPQIKESGVRWRTTKVLAVGAFPSSVEVERGHHAYSEYDCFLALGGYDSSTTYMMIARADHVGAYGVKGGRFGKVTRGRYVLDLVQEGDNILDIRPVVLEMSAKDSFATSDMELKLEEGMSVDTYVGVDLEKRSPVSCEQFLVIAGDGVLTITDYTPTYSANSSRTDVTLINEYSEVREEGDVTVRHEGPGTGRLYFYRKRRQLSQAHNLVGKVTNGLELLRLAQAGSKVTLVSVPSRLMVIGMTQKEAQGFLESRGMRQKRTGLQGDDARVVEQEPELTMEMREGSEVETFGVKAEKISVLELNETSPKTVRYFRKMTGLDHKPVGTMKVFFTYPDMPMITFEGNAKEAAVLLPEKSFDPDSPRGQIGITNMSRPNRGAIGIRLEVSEEFGPTGEERYGTNIAGRMISDLPLLMEGIKDGDIVYVREARPGEKAVAPPPEEVPKKIIPEDVAEIAAGEFQSHAPPPTPFGAPPEREELAGREEPAEPEKKPKPRAKRAAPRKSAAKPKKATEPKKTTGGRPRTKRPKQG